MDLDEAVYAATNFLFQPVKDVPMDIYLSGDTFGHMVEPPLKTTLPLLCLEVSTLL